MIEFIVRIWSIFTVTIVIIIIGTLINNSCNENNYSCSCGTCTGWGNCNTCQCVGPDSEGCHIAGWDMSSPCCNESSSVEECKMWLK